MVFFSLLSTAFSSIFYGIIVTAAVMALLYVLLQSVSPSMVRTPVFYVTGVVLAVLLLIQTSLLIGAVQARNVADAAGEYATQLLEDSADMANAAEDSQEVIDAVTREFPVIGSFVDIADFAGNDVADLATTMHATVHDYLGSYIWRRVWWALGIIVAACVMVILFDQPQGSRRAKRSSASHHVRRHTRASSRQRIHRR